MRIVVHAGSNKAGSTAIQNTCAAHRDILEQAGILYPKVGSKNDHSMLLPAILDDQELLGNLNRRSPEGRATGAEESRALWRTLADDVATSRNQILLLSSEFIFGLRPQSLERFLSRLRVLSDNIEVIVYLRDPCDHYLSSAQQVLKYGASVKDPRSIQNYGHKLRRLDLFFPDRVRRKVYSRDLLVQGDVSIDLLSELLTPEHLSELDISPSISNSSMSSEAMALLRKFNIVNWGERRIVGSPMNKVILKGISELEAKGSYTKAVLRPEIHDIVTGIHVQDMLWIKEHYGLRFAGFNYAAAPIEALSDEKDSRLSQLEVEDIVTYDSALLEVLTQRLMAWSLERSTKHHKTASRKGLSWLAAYLELDRRM